MEKLTIQDLRDRGWIAFEYVRGSHAYGLNTETSDKDIGGVFIIPQDYLMGLRSNYIEQVADETNDTVFYEYFSKAFLDLGYLICREHHLWHPEREHKQLS
jgi:hypothetical protein